MICPFCNNQIPDSVQADIEKIGHFCSSACDMAVKVNAKCANCSRVFWSQWIGTPYLHEIKFQSTLMTADEPEMPKWASAMKDEKGVCEWEYKEGKLYFYLDLNDLPFEIVAG